MTNGQKIIATKLGLLKLAEQLGNVQSDGLFTRELLSFQGVVRSTW